MLPASLLAGCALTSTSPSATTHGMSIHGNVHGGQQPIAGAHVYLLAAAATGYGSPSVSLLDGNATGFADALGGYVPTDSNGGWDITGVYACTPNSQVYVFAQGGDPGAGVNSASALMAVLGNCPSSGNFATATPFVWVNEVSTVAAAYAMSGYAVDATHVASSGSPLALTGIANAFANAANLADLASGTALATTPAGNGTVPSAQINLLANVAAACINSTGPGSLPCATLLGEATSDGTPSGSAPAETASALINIAHHPGANVADFFNLTPPVAPFNPSPATQPADLTLSLSYTGGGLNGPTSVAIDALGNAWVSNQGSSTLTALSGTGAPLSGSPFSGNGISSPGQVAIDIHGNAWVADTGSSMVSAFDTTGTPLLGSPFTSPGIGGANAVAFDQAGDTWIASPGMNSVTELAASSSAWSFTQSLNLPTAVAVDRAGNVWVTNEGNNSVSLLDTNGAPQWAQPVTGDGLDLPYSVAIDGTGNAWVANVNGQSLTVLDVTGTPLPGSPFTAGGLNSPVATAFDGAGNVWVANAGSQGVTELDAMGNPAVGSPFQAPSLASALSVAVDGAGSVWLANSGANTVTELIGAAVPAVTPISAAIASGLVGARP